MNLKHVVCIALFTACTGSMSPVQLMNWLDAPENELTKEHPGSGFVWRATCLPSELLTYKQFHVLKESYTDSAFDATEESYESGRYFKFSLDFSDNSTAAKSFLEENSDYLNFYIARDLILLIEGDSLPCSMANLERSANITPQLQYEVAFDIPEPYRDKDFTLVYKGELSGDTTKAFDFEYRDIKNIPQLKR